MPRASPPVQGAGAAALPAWKLEDAKARFSEVVRLAREQGPQRVTVRGQDAVVVLSVADYAHLAPAAATPTLFALWLLLGSGVVSRDRGAGLKASGA